MYFKGKRVRNLTRHVLTGSFLVQVDGNESFAIKYNEAPKEWREAETYGLVTNYIVHPYVKSTLSKSVLEWT